MPPGRYVFKVIAANRDGVWKMQERVSRLRCSRLFIAQRGLSCSGFLLPCYWSNRMALPRRNSNAGTPSSRAFSQQLIASQENERKRIAAELHDSLGQRLVVIKNLALFFLRSQEDTAISNGRLQLIEEISEEAALAADESREISYNLRPFQLDRLGLSKAIEGIIRTASDASATVSPRNSIT